MIRFDLFFGVFVLGLCVYSLVDVIGRSDDEIRNLPKLWWMVLVLLFPLAGSIAWLVAGRPQGSPRPSAHDRPGRAAAVNPENDAEFLRKVRERAEEQRRAYREEQRRKQQGEPEAGS